MISNKKVPNLIFRPVNPHNFPKGIPQNSHSETNKRTVTFRPLHRLMWFQPLGFQKGTMSALQINQITFTFHVLEAGGRWEVIGLLVAGTRFFWDVPALFLCMYFFVHFRNLFTFTCKKMVGSRIQQPLFVTFSGVNK